jgi:nucleotide-binding universal stress UspA family protein
MIEWDLRRVLPSCQMDTQVRGYPQPVLGTPRLNTAQRGKEINMRPIMLALSTFRKSGGAIRLAIEKAKKGKHLIVFFVVDVNLARYLIGTDLSLFPELQASCEEEVLERHKKSGEEIVKSIAQEAEQYGIKVKTMVEIGRFALKCLEAVKQETPELIITTRSKRPEWVKKFFGSPVDYLIANAGCSVIEA